MRLIPLLQDAVDLNEALGLLLCNREEIRPVLKSVRMAAIKVPSVGPFHRCKIGATPQLQEPEAFVDLRFVHQAVKGSLEPPPEVAGQRPSDGTVLGAAVTIAPNTRTPRPELRGAVRPLCPASLGRIGLLMAIIIGPPSSTHHDILRPGADLIDRSLGDDSRRFESEGRRPSTVLRPRRKGG